MATSTPTPPSPTPAAITIIDKNPDDINNTQYEIILNNTTHISTTVTSSPTEATSWITSLGPTPPTLVGLDIEWRPNKAKNSDNKTATLQLCTHQKDTNTLMCLVFQLIHCPPPLPHSLSSFLESKDTTFVGVGIEEDLEKLLVDFDLKVENWKEIRDVGGKGKMGNVGLKEMARVVLGIEVEKPKKVTMSRWDVEWLSYDQIQYATVDAYLSFAIGTKLLGESQGEEGQSGIESDFDKAVDLGSE